MIHSVTYRQIGKFALNYWKRRPKSGLAAMLFMLLALGMDMIFPVYVGKTVDVLSGAPDGNPEVLKHALYYFSIFMVLGILHIFLRASALFFWNWFAVRNMFEIVTEAMRKVQRFSADWHANAFAGATVRKITRGMWSFDMFEDTLFMGLFPALAMMVGMTGVLIVTVPDVGVFTAFSMIAYCGFNIGASVKILAPLFRLSAAADTKLGATLADIITGNPTVKSFGSERREDSVFFETGLIWRKRAQKSWQTAQGVDLIRNLLRMVMMAGMFGLTIWMWSQGRASSGDIALVLTSYFIIGGYSREIGMHISNLQKSASELEDIVHFWQRQDEIQDRPDAKPLRIGQGGRGPGEIEFDRVTFGYASQSQPVFQDFSVHIRPGEKIALVGPSGSGKSTFAKILQRLYDVQGGEIRIDGQNIAHVTQESLRHAIALVPQDPILFHRSLAENIAYSQPGIEMDRVIEAAREAYADDFIRTLKLGYETPVGERGIKLSGGERQRVAIARAILADAPILILDEATSSLDSISEHYIQKALESLIRGKTTITIAHRLATIRKADRILVFNHGQIVEQGIHDDLIRRKSQYKQLFDMQALDLVG